MTSRSSRVALAGLLLASSVLFPVPAAGHQKEALPEGTVFTVRDASDISTLEQIVIFTRRALAPLAPPNVTPLHAYKLEHACDDRLLRHASLRGLQYGPAALVEAAEATAEAWYFRTPYEAISTARVIGWCDERVVKTSEQDRYFFATTYPIGGVNGLDGFGEPARRFMSMEAGRIDEYLREQELPESLVRETAFWEAIHDSDDPADFRAYLVWRPNGTYAPLARNRLEALLSTDSATSGDSDTPNPAALDDGDTPSPQ